MQEQRLRSSLTLSGPLTVQNATKFRGDIIAKFEECDHDGFDLELTPDSAADLSAVQLILAARKFAAEQHKQFMLKKPASGPLRDVLEQAGFVAKDAADSRKFWLHEETAS